MNMNFYLKRILLGFTFCLLLLAGCMGQKKGKTTTKTPAPKPPMTAAEIQQKVQELISKMTLEEKVGQMTQINLNVILKGSYSNQDGTIDTAKLREAVVKYKVGSVLNAINHAYSVETWHKIITQIQDAAMKTPNKIPVIYGIDAIHGVTFTLNSTLFPQNIGIGATRNPELSKLAGEITAKETRASGIRWNFAPVLDVGRMPLWPRFGETYGEDPYLVAQMGTASIIGMEGDGNLNRIDRVASCMKHYLGYSLPWTGKDRTPAYIPERQLREIFLPPFAAAVKAGSSTIMINSSEINGIPVHGDKYLLTDVLRGELGFTGLVVTDWEDIIRLHTKHRIAPTMKEAVRIAINAGIDMSMVPHEDYIENFYKPLIELVNEGKVSKERINEAVSRILTVKYRLGLMENAYPEKDAIAQFGKPEYKAAALEAARESITLLKNKDNILPLPKDKKILVTGPGAKSITSLNGAWSYTWQGNVAKWYPDTAAHIFNAIKSKVSSPSNLLFTRGTKFEGKDYDIKETADLAKSVDYIILCLGEDAYAESPGVIDDLTLPDVQIQLAKALIATGKPIVLVLTEGRPRIVREIEPGIAGILMAYIPGSQGHNAIADVIFGDYNPNGKLPFSYPKFTGDLLTYDHRLSDRITELQPGRMGENGYKPQWPFGFGLSYTKYEYSNLKLSSKTLKGNETLKVTVDVKNVGSKAGKEAVELYTRDHFASVTPAFQRLRKFKKVSINPGQTVTVEFELTKQDLAFIGLDSKSWVVEPGDFDVTIGGLKDTFTYQE
jgi:beta-glucosidase